MYCMLSSAESVLYIKAAQQCRQARTFARKFDIDNFYDVGDMGVEHALLPEKGLVAAGMATGKAWFKVPAAIKVVPVSYTHLAVYKRQKQPSN